MTRENSECYLLGPIGKKSKINNWTVRKFKQWIHFGRDTS